MNHIVVVGASLAGIRACGGLRNDGFDGTITLVGAETHLPYDRPPLSKKVLSGEWEPDRIALMHADEFDSLQLQRHLGKHALNLSTEARTIALDDGSTVPFDGLVIATGASPRRLPNQIEDDSVVVLRTLDESLALRARLAEGTARVTVIGAGFIGLEVAATARSLGNDVVVLEGLPAPLIRGLGAEMGSAVALIHEDQGVEIRCGLTVLGITRVGDEIAVHVSGHDDVISDIVIVGIGVAVNTGWLEGSGLELRDGIVCDETLNVGVAGIYAAGDVARWPNLQFDGEEMRVEHWTNAAEQGLAVAKNLLAEARGDAPEPYAPVPFFWSDQYKSRIQFMGRAAGDDEILIVKGSMEERSFLALYGKHGKFRGALGLSMPKPLMKCRKLLLDRLSFDEAVEAAAEL
jgi:NADPH-dependent 2,4-dienoyl-CoA reductase/sulfur reductase-like enzyme